MQTFIGNLVVLTEETVSLRCKTALDDVREATHGQRRYGSFVFVFCFAAEKVVRITNDPSTTALVDTHIVSPHETRNVALNTHTDW